MIDCACSHPYDAHDVTDDEYGPCYATADPNDPEGDCPCDVYSPADRAAEDAAERRFER
jgi:hypothetical protein